MEHEVEYLKNIANYMEDIVIFIKKDLTITYMNQVGWDIFQRVNYLTTDNVYGNKLDQVFPDVNRVRHHLDECLRDNKSKIFEEYYIPVDQWWHYNCFPSTVSGEFGIIFRQVPVPMREESSYERGLTYVRTVLDNVPMAVVTINDSEKVIDWNNQAELMYGWSFEEVKYKRVSDFIVPPDFKDKHLELINNYKNHGESTDLYRYLRRPVLTKSGLTKIVEVYIAPHRFKDELYFTAFSIDVTSKVQKEQALERTQLHVTAIETIIEHAGMLLFAKDLDGKYVYVNKNTKIVLPHEEMIGKTDRDIFDEEDVLVLEHNDKQVIETGETLVSEEIFHMPQSGERHYALSTKTPRRDIYGNIVGVFGMSQDMTHYKRALLAASEAEKQHLRMKEELAMQASQMKSQFLANMSHEIRTPLNGIVGMLTLLEFTVLSDQQNKFVKGIRTASEALLTIVNDILDFSKIEAGHVELEDKDIDVLKLIEDITSVYQFDVNTKGLVLYQQIHLDQPTRYIKGDYGRIRQILNNLMSNAVKFTLSGHVVLRCYLEQTTSMSDDSGIGVNYPDIIVFEIEDTGIGISKENQDKLFKPFIQTEKTISKRFGGTGLGLSIAKNLVDLMGGTIGFSSVENVGSTFWFKLPFRKGSPPSETIVLETDTQSDASSSINTENAKFVLVVEDNPMNMTIAMKLLEHLNCKVEGAENGRIAIDMLKASPDKYGVVLMDMQMPVLNGYDATKEIRQSNNDIAIIPIIAMTATVIKEEVKRFYEIGIDDYIPKPIDFNVLNQKVHYWNGRQHSTKTL